MKKIHLILFTLLFLEINAQTSPYDAVERFFDAFHTKDSIVLQEAFASDARLQRAEIRNGISVVRNSSIPNFIKAASNRPETAIWDERLGDPIVQQHQNLATVWVPYRFYLNNQLSHCGFNSFTLVRLNSVWKILSLIDTSSQECN